MSSAMLNQVSYLSAVDFLISEGFDIRHLIRDHRGDGGDDAGYIISDSEKSGKRYLHCLEINHNNQLSSFILDEKKDTTAYSWFIPDYIVVQDDQEVINQLSKLTGVLSLHPELDSMPVELDDCDSDCPIEYTDDPIFEEILKEWTATERDWFRKMQTPFREYSEQDLEKMRNFLIEPFSLFTFRASL